MLTYQLQRRNFKIGEGQLWTFPNDAEIQFSFEPQEPFGTRHGHSRTALRNVKATALYNANNGFSTVLPETPLDPVHVGVHFDNIKYKLYVQCRCETQDELGQIIYQLQGLLPPILNVFLYDAPFITIVSGKVGETAFGWELAEAQFSFQITSNEQQESDLHEALMLYGSKLGPGAYRIHGALGYFYKACRLLAAGNGPWEFMPEVILNLTKTLEILFDTPQDGAAQEGKRSRDRIRSGLKGVGVDVQLIEHMFIRIAILRNEFDVGHGRLALHDMGDLQLIYRFVITAEQEFRKLFHQIVAGLGTGTLSLPPYSPKIESSYSKPLRGLIDALRAREAAASAG
jgi:hypothetical protein